MNKSSRLDLRLKPAQRRAYEICAQRSDMKLAEWIRTTLDAASLNRKKQRTLTPQAAEALKRVV